MGSIEMKILIKGAGDLATGIASRLYGAGHQIMMTDIAVPLTVRRLVAFSRAVYEGEAVVEDMTARLAKNQEEAEKIMEQGDIPVIVDPKAECIQWFQPDVIVDAILAKRNLGTNITDAPFVIGVGPGFTAGEDCNCVVETKRGHTLGNVIWDGSAIPNTGVPGNVGGYSIERLIKASADGDRTEGCDRRSGTKRTDCCNYRRRAGLCADGRYRSRNASARCSGDEGAKDRRY